MAARGVHLALKPRISSGAVGAPEGQLELELELKSLSQLEAFFGAIPREEQAAWSRRLEPFITGSTTWEIMQVHDVYGEASRTAERDNDTENDYHEVVDDQDEDNEDDDGSGMMMMMDEETSSSGPGGAVLIPSAEDFARALDADGDPTWMTGAVDLSGLKNVRSIDGTG